MATLLFSGQADDMLTALEADPARALLVGRLHTALDLLEADPGDVRCRRRRFQGIGVWGIPVVVDEEEWLILWEPGEGGDAIVQAIAPAPSV